MLEPHFSWPVVTGSLCLMNEHWVKEWSLTYWPNTLNLAFEKQAWKD